MTSTNSRKRGRPRSFDAAVAVDRALATFLEHGYAGASLEALTTAMELTKPSLYAAFGDKRGLFVRVLEARAATLGRRYRAAFVSAATLEGALHAMFVEAIVINLGEGAPPGCIIGSAAVTEAIADHGLASFIRDFFALCDRHVGEWIAAAYAPTGAVAAPALGRLVNGIIHDIAMRARVGEPRAKLRAYARDAATALARAAQ